MNRKPWMKWFPADWRKDPNVQSCSIAARGLWREALDIMHETPVYGKLCLEDGTSLEPSLPNLAGVPPKLCARLLKELEAHGVPSRDENGILFSRRMVRDHYISEVRSKSGSKGGNPDLVKQRDKQEVKLGRARADSSEDRRQKPPNTPPPSAKQKKTFQKPTAKEVTEYAKSISFDRDGQYFIDYQKARGWILSNGKPMKDWKATVRTWKRNHDKDEEKKKKDGGNWWK